MRNVWKQRHIRIFTSRTEGWSETDMEKLRDAGTEKCGFNCR